MYKSTEKRNSYKFDIVCLVVLALIPRLIYLFWNMSLPGGLPQAYDTKGYLEQAHQLINNGSFDFDLNGFFYIGFYSILGVFLKFIGSTTAFVVLQMIVNALTVVLVYKFVLEISDRKVALISGILYSFLFPVIYWSIFIITDSLFYSLMVLQAYLAVLCIKYNRNSSWIKLLLLSMYMIVFRPTGIISFGFTIIYLLINIDIKEFIIKYKRILAAGIGVFLVIVIFSFDKIISIAGSIERNMHWLLTEVYSNGQMYDIQTPYDLKFNAKIPPGYDIKFALAYYKCNFLDILALYMRRIVSFAGVWVWRLGEMQAIHILKYLVTYGTAFVLIIIGIIDMVRKRIFKIGSIVLFMIGSIMIFTTFFFMDSAYRYRVPALIFGAYLVAQGIIAVLDKLKTYKKSSFKVNKY